jgi:hypothetical protein
LEQFFYWGALGAVGGDLTSDEKTFLRQLWMFDEELDKALQIENYDRIFLLMNGLSSCFTGIWKKHLPGNSEFESSGTFKIDLQSLVFSVLNRASKLCNESLTAKIDPFA